MWPNQCGARLQSLLPNALLPASSHAPWHMPPSLWSASSMALGQCAVHSNCCRACCYGRQCCISGTSAVRCLTLLPGCICGWTGLMHKLNQKPLYSRLPAQHACSLRRLYIIHLISADQLAVQPIQLPTAVWAAAGHKGTVTVWLSSALCSHE